METSGQTYRHAGQHTHEKNRSAEEEQLCKVTLLYEDKYGKEEAFDSQRQQDGSQKKEKRGKDESK